MNSVRAAARRRHVAGQLQPLGLAARERVGRLAEPQIIEPHVDQLLQPRLHLRAAAEERERLADGHVQHVGDVPAAIVDVENLLAIAAAVALAALHVHVGQKLHVDLDVAVALARACSGRRRR